MCLLEDRCLSTGGWGDSVLVMTVVSVFMLLSFMRGVGIFG